MANLVLVLALLVSMVRQGCCDETGQRASPKLNLRGDEQTMNDSDKLIWSTMRRYCMTQLSFVGTYSIAA